MQANSEFRYAILTSYFAHLIYTKLSPCFGSAVSNKTHIMYQNMKNKKMDDTR